MHLYFEQNTSAKCDCSILSLSWMGKVPDELPEDEGWKLNRTNYYQEGWLATGNVRGIVGVTFTSSHCRKNAEVPLRTNYNLRGHRSDVILVKWNEPYQKLASCDSSGVIFVWIKYEGRWSIELINDRNTPVTHFSWSHDGRMALICYQDGFVLVGSVAGQRYWSSMLNLEATITCGIWTPDDQQVYFGTTAGQIIVMDVHGAMVSQVQLSSDAGIADMAWSCEKFKMEEGEDAEPGAADASGRTFVLAVSFRNGRIQLLKNYDDVSPIRVRTDFDGRYMAMEWSNSRELLAVAGVAVEPDGGTREPPVYSNAVKFYSDSGVLLYSTAVPGSQMPVSAMTWGHNDRRVFVATGCGVQVARAWRRLGSLQLLARLRLRTALRRHAHLSALPLPPRLAALVAALFTHTISCCVPEASAVREFVGRAARVGRLHCTMLRRSGDSGSSAGAGGAGVSYTLYLEHLGGLVPLLRGRRISKIRPEFVIYDPQCEGADSDDLHWFRARSSGEVARSSSSSGNSSARSGSSASSHAPAPRPTSDSSDSDRDEGCSGSPRLQRRRRARRGSARGRSRVEREPAESADELACADSLPEDVPLVEVTSNIWGTKFKIHGLAKSVPANLGQVTYKTSLLHLQPRQMTLVMTELRDDLPTGPDPNFDPNIFSEDEEETFRPVGDRGSPVRGGGGDAPAAVAPTSPRAGVPSRARPPPPQRGAVSRGEPGAGPGAAGCPSPALARAESYEDELAHADAEAAGPCGTAPRAPPRDGAAARGHAGAAGGCGVSRSAPSPSPQRSGSSHCPGRHAVSPLCCEGSVPTLQSPKNAVAPSDIMFDRPPAQTMMSYHASGSDFSQNVQQVKSNMSGAESHARRPTFDLSLTLDRSRQVSIRKVDSHADGTAGGSLPGATPTRRGAPQPALFGRCGGREKSPSPCCDGRRDDMKYIDEESVGTFPSEVSMESSRSRRPTPVGDAPVADKMVRSCSAGYLDGVQSRLVPCEVTLAALRRDAPKRLVLVNGKGRSCGRRHARRRPPAPDLGRDADADRGPEGGTPRLGGCGKSKSLDSGDMLLIARPADGEAPPAPAGGGADARRPRGEPAGPASPPSGEARRGGPRERVDSGSDREAAADGGRARGAPAERPRGPPSESGSSPGSDGSGRSGPAGLAVDRRAAASEIEIERPATPSPAERRGGGTLSGAALATLEQLLHRARDRGSAPPSSPAPRSRLPRSSPASPAPSKKSKRTASASPIRKHILNSPLLGRRRNKSKNQESSDDETGAFSGDEVVNGKNYRDLETFQKAQLRQKLKRGKIEPAGGGGWAPQPSAPVRREFVMHNKAPMWNESSQVYQLDFGGRVTQESAKNFQIEFRGKQVMQFGRIDGNAYTLDFQYPFSALQAFAVALANVTQRLK